MSARTDRWADELADVIRDTAYRDSGLPTGPEGDVAAAWIDAGARAAMAVLHERGRLYRLIPPRRGTTSRGRWIQR